MELYLNYGEEDFLRNYNTEKIVKDNPLQNAGINLIRINDTNIDKLVANCEQIPFMDEKKVVIVKDSGIFSNTNKKVSADTIENIVEYVCKLPDYIIMIFNEANIDKRTSAFKKISKNANCNEYQYCKIVDLSNWICRGMKSLGGEIDFETAQYLAEMCGPSMTYIHSEVQKLAILNKVGGKISKKIIDDVCMKSEQGIIFDLTDSIGERNTSKALKLVENLVLQKQAEQYILVMLYKHVRNIYMVKVAQEEGKFSSQELGINPYVLKKITSQVNNFTCDELKTMLNKLINIDYESKTGKIDIRIGIDCFISQIA